MPYPSVACHGPHTEMGCRSDLTVVLLHARPPSGSACCAGPQGIAVSSYSYARLAQQTLCMQGTKIDSACQPSESSPPSHCSFSGYPLPTALPLPWRTFTSDIQDFCRPARPNSRSKGHTTYLHSVLCPAEALNLRFKNLQGR